MPDRPHRLARLVNVPERVEVVPVELLQAVAATAAKPTAPAPRQTATGNTSRLDVGRWLTDRGVGYRVKERPDNHGRTVYLLAACPFNKAHGPGGDTAIYQAADGKLGAGVQT